MQFTTVRSKEKDYDIYLKSEKLDSQKVAIWNQKMVHNDKHCCSYLEREKSGRRPKNVKKYLFRARRQKFLAKKHFTAIQESEKLVHSQQEHEKNVSQLFGSGKNWFLAISRQILLQLFGERKKWIPAIWRPKNVVHNCQEQGKRL